jgi:hypothetical protein
MLHGRHLALAGVAAVAFGVAAAAVGCANGTPTDDGTFTGDDGGGVDSSVPLGEGGNPLPTGDGGCQQKSDCPENMVCDTTTGTCVACAGDGDCPAGSVCDTNAKTCGPGCSPAHACPSGQSCCNNKCVTTNTVTACTGCGLACDTTHSTGPSCDGKTCAYTGCGAGFGDCKKAAPDVDGCETPLTTPTDCGSCGRACSTTNVNGTPTCAAGACNSACAAGWGNCSLPVAGPDGGVADDGCESNLTTCAGTPCCGTLCGKHQNGVPGQTYLDCASPLGTPGNAATYTAKMANEAATAWAQGTLGTSTCNGTGDAVVYAQTATQCAVWTYTGSAVGHMLVNDGAGYCGAGCCCVRTSDPTWN